MIASSQGALIYCNKHIATQCLLNNYKAIAFASTCFIIKENEMYRNSSNKNIKSQYNQAKYRGNKYFNSLIIYGILFMFFYGMLLPANWEQKFGIFAKPIIFAAENVPSITKLTEISSVKELTRGYFGLGVYIVPLFSLLIVFFCREFENRIIHAFHKTSRSFLKTFTIIYFIGLPLIIFIFYLYYINPIFNGSLSGGNRGELILIFMLKYRLMLSLLGSIYTVGLGILGWIAIAIIMGPIILLVKKIRNIFNGLN